MIRLGIVRAELNYCVPFGIQNTDRYIDRTSLLPIIRLRRSSEGYSVANRRVYKNFGAIYIMQWDNGRALENIIPNEALYDSLTGAVPISVTEVKC